MIRGIDAFNAAFNACPLVAILRGARPDECVRIAAAIVDAGFKIIEVPLNSPSPLDSISRLARYFGSAACVGAGTVLEVSDVQAVRAADGQLVVSPNSDAAVVSATVDAGMASVPGYWTPTEAFSALRAGAHALKFFPAESANPQTVKAHRAVLPPATRLIVVGGVLPENLSEFHAAGASGFGIGSALFTPGLNIPQISARARAFVEAQRSLMAEGD